jgi:hypothetical protein
MANTYISRIALGALGMIALMTAYGGCGGGGSTTSTFVCGAGSLNESMTNVANSNDLDTSAFSGTNVNSLSGSGFTDVTTKVCGAPVLRAFAIHINGALANGQVYTLSPAGTTASNYVLYTQTDSVAGGTVTAQWISASGNITVNNVTANGFSYTFTGSFQPNTINGITQASGTFDSTGTGAVNEFTQ